MLKGGEFLSFRFEKAVAWLLIQGDMIRHLDKGRAVERETFNRGSSGASRIPCHLGAAVAPTARGCAASARRTVRSAERRRPSGRPRRGKPFKTLWIRCRLSTPFFMLSSRVRRRAERGTHRASALPVTFRKVSSAEEGRRGGLMRISFSGRRPGRVER